MARKPTHTEPQPARLNVDDMRRGMKRLQKRLQEVEAFDPRTLDRQDPWSTVRPLSTSIETALDETFGKGTVEYNRYAAASRFDWPIIMGGDVDHHRKVQHVVEDRIRSIQLLTDAVDLLNDRIEAQAESANSLTAVVAAIEAVERSSRIFIVHGHDEGTKEAVARFISKLGFEPVILHERANRGRTIIEKFRDEAADIGFAIVLMSPDDEMAGGSKRARQNVILELGFFLGALGSANVAALVRGDVETPSDFDGVLYIKVDDTGMWRMLLAKELKASGYDVDMNKAV